MGNNFDYLLPRFNNVDSATAPEYGKAPADIGDIFQKLQKSMEGSFVKPLRDQMFDQILTVHGQVGLKIITDENMVEIAEDWSEVRSRSRAKRRRAMGHPQRIKIIRKPKAMKTPFGIVVHPSIYQKLKTELAERVDKAAEKQMYEAFMGGGSLRK